MGLELIKNPDIRQSLIANGHDPEELIEALTEYIKQNREVDKTSKDLIGKNEFYERELRYSNLEKLIINLKST